MPPLTELAFPVDGLLLEAAARWLVREDRTTHYKCCFGFAAHHPDVFAEPPRTPNGDIATRSGGGI